MAVTASVAGAGGASVIADAIDGTGTGVSVVTEDTVSSVDVRDDVVCTPADGDKVAVRLTCVVGSTVGLLVQPSKIGAASNNKPTRLERIVFCIRQLGFHSNDLYGI